MTKSALIIAYSRPAGVSTLLKSLTSNQVDRIYVSIDGPRNETDRVNQAEILNILKEFQATSKAILTTRISQENLGVSGGVLSAIDWFFEQESEGLILEDDLVVGDDFFNFAFTGLEKFKGNSSIWMISGTQLFPDFDSKSKEIWINYPMIWGWASWAEKWSFMRQSLLQIKRIPVSEWTSARHIFWSIGANRALDGKVDTWDIPLACEFFKLGKICILPPVNLISNVGDDEYSTHTSSSNTALHQKLNLLPVGFKYFGLPQTESINAYNQRLESEVFQIGKKHLLLPIYAFLLDWFRFPKRFRKQPLNLRTDWNKFRAP